MRLIFGKVEDINMWNCSNWEMILTNFIKRGHNWQPKAKFQIAKLKEWLCLEYLPKEITITKNGSSRDGLRSLIKFKNSKFYLKSWVMLQHKNHLLKLISQNLNITNFNTMFSKISRTFTIGRCIMTITTLTTNTSSALEAFWIAIFKNKTL